MVYAVMKPIKPSLEETQEQIHEIRITLSSKNVKNLEKGTVIHVAVRSLNLVLLVTKWNRREGPLLLIFLTKPRLQPLAKHHYAKLRDRVDSQAINPCSPRILNNVCTRLGVVDGIGCPTYLRNFCFKVFVKDFMCLCTLFPSLLSNDEPSIEAYISCSSDGIMIEVIRLKAKRLCR
uniref:Uncharacterized protein n=1 Tax=Cucumis melo TaxID=3656 RepID=A0A9I9E709_CUCME